MMPLVPCYSGNTAKDVQAVKLPEVFRDKFKNSGLLQKTAGQARLFDSSVT